MKIEYSVYLNKQIILPREKVVWLMFKSIQFPDHFLFGTATASLQIEGGDRNNNWYRFCEQNKTEDGTHCFIAADSWQRYDEDIKLMKQLNQGTYRLSIEWARIMPTSHEVNQEALNHYRQMISALIDANIKPLVTLHHFSNPIWFEDMGGWANQDAVLFFDQYVRHVINHLGDLVSDWVTINEPNVYVEGTYSSGIFPPNKPNFKLYFDAAKQMVLAHLRAYRIIHQMRQEKFNLTDSQVGVAHHLRVFQGENKGDKAAARMLDYVFHDIFLEGMTYGKLLPPLGKNQYPLGKNVFADFIGVNYYSRDMVKFTNNPLRMFGELTVKNDAPVNDLGWEIYPQGLVTVCARVFKKYQLPIFITENGICDLKDLQRPQFIIDHLQAIDTLLNKGIPIERYYHWSLMDNFEWELGFTPKFGLIHIDEKTQTRSIRKSGHLYGEISKNKNITSAIYQKYFD